MTTSTIIARPILVRNHYLGKSIVLETTQDGSAVMFLDTLGEDINFFMVARKVKPNSPWKLYRITEEDSRVLDSFSSWQDALVTMKLSCAHIRVLNVPPHTLLYPTYEDTPGIK